jgi:hypothetical protein
LHEPPAFAAAARLRRIPSHQPDPADFPLQNKREGGFRQTRFGREDTKPKDTKPKGFSP